MRSPFPCPLSRPGRLFIEATTHPDKLMRRTHLFADQLIAGGGYERGCSACALMKAAWANSPVISDIRLVCQNGRNAWHTAVL